jgi:hypothetical protein
MRSASPVASMWNVMGDGVPCLCRVWDLISCVCVPLPGFCTYMYCVC